MVALPVVMFHILLQRSPQRRFSKQDRSPSSDFPSPSAPPSVLFPHLVLGALHFDGISTHQICSPRASDTNPESYQAWPLPPRPPVPFDPGGDRSRPASPFSFGKEQPTLDLATQNPVLRRRIFVSQQEFLIDCSGDIGKQARPERLGFPHNLKLRER
jgi:hypothetical protein